MTIRLGLLALLDVADMNGDELTAAFDRWVGPAWTVDRSEVGEALDELARAGLVLVTTSHAPEQVRAAYTLTRAGRRALADWFGTDPATTPPPREELVAKILVALHGGRDRALTVITDQRSALTAALQWRRRASRRTAEREEGREDGLGALPPVLVEDARLTRAEAELRWLDLCEARLLATDGATATNGATHSATKGGGGA